ncbi:MAG: pre-peptidase C-terminal domain-containing protein [Planctomycetaceae bacterium]|nr:pre-peptidase C-terminal domain-containing protein [Planctomycetaceae bacterium]
MPRPARRAALSLAFLSAFSVASIASAQAPSVTTLTPQAVLPGQNIDVTLSGANLKGATGLVTTFPSTSVLSPDVKDNGTNPASVVFRVTTPADAPVGIHALRVATPGGVSPLKFVIVDDLPSVAQAANGTLATAQALTLPIAVDGSVASLGKQFFKFTVAANQKVSFEVVARRMGSALDPFLRILNAQGREIANADDSLGLTGDCQLSYTFAAAGEYFVEVRDVQNRGGGNFNFRLRVGDFPLLNVPYPMAVKRGADATVNVAGPDLDGVQPVVLKAPATPGAVATTAGVKRAGGKSSGFVSLALVDGEEALEVEPNNTADKATRVNLGAGLNGRLELPGDVDRFVFTAKANQKMTFKAITRQQGSPVDLTLKVFKPDGALLVEAEDVGTEDALVNAVFPADGDYQLQCSDLLNRGGPQFAYRVEVYPTPVAGFSVAVNADSLNIPAGGTVNVPIVAARAGYTGPIQIAAVDLPPGVTSVPTVIGMNLTTAMLTVKANPDAASGKPFPIRVVGTAKVGEATVEVPGTVDAAIKTANAAMPFAPAVVSRDMALAVAPAIPIALRAEPAEIILGQSLAASVKVIATRQPMYDEDITLALATFGTPPQTGLPPGLTAAVKPIAKGTNEVEIVFTATAQAPLSEYTAVLIGTLKHGNETHTVAVPGVMLKMQAPMTIAAAAVEPKVAKGGMLKVKVTVQRNPAFKGPVTLTFQNLPKGVTAAAAMLTPEQKEVEVVLTAAADAAVGAAANVTVKADGQGVGNAALSVTSAAVPFTVE